MWRSLLAFAFAFAAWTSADATTRWQGHWRITDAAGDCDFDPVGDRGIIRYKPNLPGSGDGPGVKLSLFAYENVNSFDLPSGHFTPFFKQVETMAVHDGYGPSDNPVYIRYLYETPLVITQATVFVDLIMQIKGWDNMPGCIVTVRASMLPRN